jgi:hypothetical protein
MIVNLNGRPRVGKLTIARALSKLIDGRVLDNHAVTRSLLLGLECKTKFGL